MSAMMVARSARDETPESRTRSGVRARARVAPEAQAQLSATDRASPVKVLREQAESRLPELVPLRHARMGESPFAFYRGTAAVMAADLARTPSSGLNVQLCGDAHLSNFGLFGSPERRLVFDINDFDETFRGPWEWDLKRLAASLVVAGRENGFSGKQTRKIVLAAVRRYQEAMAEFAELGNLEVWYARVDVDQEWERLTGQLDKAMSRRLADTVQKARGRDHRQSLAKLTEVIDGDRRIVPHPPTIVPLSEATSSADRDQVDETVQDLLRRYISSLTPDRRELLRSFRLADIAYKVGGVGSVGTRCWIVLMSGRDTHDALFLQMKEARDSVLARHIGGTTRGHEGARVVTGQRLMQASSDIFLGWTRGVGLDRQSRDYYFRQLHDWKGSATIEAMPPKGMRLYGELCAWTLARAHARSGDRIALAAYLGTDDGVAQAVATFASSYADLTEQDFGLFTDAMESGELASLN